MNFYFLPFGRKIMHSVSLLSLCIFIALASACPCNDCSSASVTAGSHYLIVRDCLPPCFVELETARVSGGNYTVALATYQDYLLFDKDLWQMPTLISSEGRTTCYAAGRGKLPLQVPAGKLALVFQCLSPGGSEDCVVDYRLAVGQTPVDGVRRVDVPFEALLAGAILAGMMLCGVAALCGVCVVAAWLPRRKTDGYELLSVEA